MRHPREHSAHVVLSDRLYVIGGYIRGDADRYYCVEYYDPSSNEWRGASQLGWHRQNAVAHVSNEFIYVLGGFDVVSGRAIQYVERYDPNGDRWTQVIYNLCYR